MSHKTNIYQINIRQFLSYHNAASLHDLSIKIFHDIKQRGFEYVWLMGVWTLPPVEEIHALTTTPQMEGYYRKYLPDYTQADVCGSLFSIDVYELDKNICGCEDEFKVFVQLVRDAGLKVLLDFIPNHMSIASRLIHLHPELFVSWNSHEDSDLHNYYQTKLINGRYFAYGKDPYFDPWYDTVQINWFNPETVSYFSTVLHYIASLCDGVRCDMSMLLVNDIFEKNWQAFTDYFHIKPNTHIWEKLIITTKQTNPDFIFLGECYWDMELTLIKYGFDYVYYKKWLDFIKTKPSFKAISYFISQIPPELTNKAVFFIENHDEERAASIFPDVNEYTLAQTITQHLPYSYLENWGQKERFIYKAPVQLKRISTVVSDT